MTRIGLLSDTHSWWDNKYLDYFQSCDEIWHAGDIGSDNITTRLSAICPVRAVYGNMDGYPIRVTYPKIAQFTIEETRVLLTHIGGYPGRYSPEIRKELYDYKPDLFVCGHSHILKVMYDDQLKCLHINPGAAGNSGIHQVRTLIRFDIDGKDIKDLEVIELAKRLL
ncbi:metallophosphatase family protein [Parabacteroides sp. OttesenSCG-928-G07]|nr:metallophosphatase family protein [Parabacteroides sp. OttesenSCG-928-G07]